MFTTLLRQPIRRTAGGKCNWSICSSRVQWLAYSWFDTASDASAYANYVKMRAIVTGYGANIFIKMAGRSLAGPTGSPCFGAEPYAVYDNAGPGFQVDIWKALADGVWSSSTTFDLYFTTAGQYFTGQCGPSHSNKNFITGCSSSIYRSGIVPSVVNGCSAGPLWSYAHITVNEDGTYSIA
jgi:hypothetical protein